MIEYKVFFNCQADCTNYCKKILSVFNLLFQDQNIKFCVTNNNKSADIIITTNFKKNSEHLDKPHIYWSGETYRCKIVNNKPYIEFNTILTTDTNSVFIPYVFDNVHFNEKHTHLRRIEPKHKSKILAFCATNPGNKNDIDRLLIFNKFCEILAPQNVSSLGKVYGNYKETQNKINGNWMSQSLIDAYSRHKFSLALENKFREGYVTEKILNVFVSGSVPIYCGCSKTVKKIFNPKCFIDINDFDSIDECIQYVKNISDDEYNQFFKEHFLNETDNILNVEFNHKSLIASDFWFNIKNNVQNFLNEMENIH